MSLSALFENVCKFTIKSSTLTAYSRDHSYHASDTEASLILYPASESEVAKVLGICNSNQIIVVPVGGRSSLEGHTLPSAASNPKRNIVVLDLSEMDRLVSINKADHDCVVEAGVSWIELADDLRKEGLFFPPDPGMQALIGGMCGTNCSGTLAHRYGTMKDNVVGLRVVMADGKIITTKRRPHKSSAGYDLTRLFIGSEGTLGVITQATLRLQSIPAFTTIILAQFPTAFLAAKTVSQVVGEGLHLSRIEFLDEYCLKSINLSEGKQEHHELPTLLFECAGRTKSSVDEQVQFIRKVSALHKAVKVEAETDKQGQNLWKIRKSAFFASKSLRPEVENVHVLTTDCAVPVSRLAEFLQLTRADLEAHNLKASIVAHAGDGNTHVFLLVDPADPSDIQKAEHFRHRNATLALEMEGTCTGEHGIGLGKKELLVEELGEEAVDVMQILKAAFDPNCILNPGKVFTIKPEFYSLKSKSKL